MNELIIRIIGNSKKYTYYNSENISYSLHILVYLYISAYVHT